MEILETNRRVLTWLSLHPIDENATTSQRAMNTVFSLLVFVVHFCSIMSAGAFILKFMSIDLEESLFALLQVVGSSSGFYTMIIGYISRHKMAALFHRLSKIVEMYKNDESFHYLMEANNKCEQLWKSYLKHGIRGFATIAFSLFVLSCTVSMLKNGYLDFERLYHPLNMVLPWNQSTTLGYFAEVCCATSTSESYLISNGSILLLFISIYMYIEAFYKMFRHSVRKLDEKNQDYNELLCKLVEFHVLIKDWFLDAIEVFSPFLLVQLISSMMILATAAFQFDLLTKADFSTMTLIKTVVLTSKIIVGVTNLFFYCYFGKHATDRFVKMSDCLYKGNWQQLPVKLQKYLIIMIINTQRPMNYHGFGLVYLNLETFCKMIQTVYTFIMIFKTVTSD